MFTHSFRLPAFATRLTAVCLTVFVAFPGIAGAATQITPALPDTPLSRAEFVAYIVRQTQPEKALDTCLAKLSPSQYKLLFNDVSRTHVYAKELCVALRYGIVRGYQDGSFLPDRAITFAESSKVLVRAFAIFPADMHPMSEPWYRSYVETLAFRGAIPDSVTALDAPMTGKQLETMTLRLSMKVETEPSIGYDELVRRTRAGYRR